jgi:hypothetical protein
MTYPANPVKRPWTRDELRRLAVVLEDPDISPMPSIAGRFARSVAVIKKAQCRLKIRRRT